jgi:hypothetical protein
MFHDNLDDTQEPVAKDLPDEISLNVDDPPLVLQCSGKQHYWIALDGAYAYGQIHNKLTNALVDEYGAYDYAVGKSLHPNIKNNTRLILIDLTQKSIDLYELYQVCSGRKAFSRPYRTAVVPIKPVVVVIAWIRLCQMTHPIMNELEDLFDVIVF